VQNIVKHYELEAKDKCYLVMPLFHVHGLMSAFLSTLAAGGVVIIPKGAKFSAQVFWGDVKTNGATWYTAVPTIHQILLARSAQEKDHEGVSLRFIRSCSASLAAPVLERLEATFKAPVVEAYAMTEAAHQMTSNPLPKHGPRKPGTVGKGTNVEIAILADDGKMKAVGEVGEVCIQGKNVTPGYHNNPKANEEGFAFGWFHTGDQGFKDADGYVTLTGRLKELINRGGEKISPLEVDSVLLSSPAIAEAVAFAAPDEKYGEEVMAAVVLRSGQKVEAAEILAMAKTKLGDFKVPKRLFIADSLPKTATGKIQRRFVAEHFLKSAKL
jgi:acyl-CoA synthetase (AMP-forming)/AMP-acid ligase II